MPAAKELTIKAEYTGVEPNLRPAASAFARMIKAVTNPDGTFTTYNVIGEYEGQGDEPDYTLEYLNDSTWGGTLESTYGQTAFDRAVGWSRWLMLNEQEPPLWSRHDFNTSLPDGDLMDDPSL